MLAGGNLHPPIDISEKHLTVTFYIVRFNVPWEQIVETRRMWLPGAPGVLLRVSGGSLPWIYALHGSLNGYWGRYIPIQAGISDCQDLLVEIKRRAPNLKPF